MAITAAMVKELREMTGVGMLDCKKALAETDGDMDKAVEYLREKGLAASQKKAGHYKKSQQRWQAYHSEFGLLCFRYWHCLL